MTRTKSPSAIRHKKIKKAVKGYQHARRKRVKPAKEALLHAGQYAYAGRKLKRRDLRRLWIVRLNAAVRQQGLSYSKFISVLKKENVELDRKILSDIAINEPITFKAIIEQVK